MDWISIFLNPQVQQMLIAVAAAILAWRKRTTIVNAAKRVTGYGEVDNRDKYAEALTLLWDNSENVDPECLCEYDAACETLSKFILRPCDKHDPKPPTPTPTPVEAPA